MQSPSWTVGVPCPAAASASLGRATSCGARAASVCARLFAGWARVSVLCRARGEGHPDRLESADALGPRAWRVPAPAPPSVPGCLRLLRNRTNETTNPWPHPRKRHTDIPSLLTFLGPSQTSVHRWAEGRDRVLTSWGRGVSGAGFCLRCRLWLLPGARNLAGLSPDPIPHCSEFRSPAPNSELAAGPPCCPDGLEELDKAAVLWQQTRHQRERYGWE